MQRNHPVQEMAIAPLSSGLGAVTIDHCFPFHDSINVVPRLPTATQLVGTVQDTASKALSLTETGLGVTDQRTPSQVSARVWDTSEELL